MKLVGFLAFTRITYPLTVCEALTATGSLKSSLYVGVHSSPCIHTGLESCGILLIWITTHWKLLRYMSEDEGVEGSQSHLHCCQWVTGAPGAVSMVTMWSLPANVKSNQVAIPWQIAVVDARGS